jgi:hypothetical protein
MTYHVDLRRAIMNQLLVSAEVLTPGEIAKRIERAGHVIPGYPAKVVADALRNEVRRGRVQKIDRGHYALATGLASATLWRIRHWEHLAKSWQQPCAAR